MQRAPPSLVKRPNLYARSSARPSKPRAKGSFYKAQKFTIQDSTFCDGSHHLEILMKLAEKIIPGATFDSSERDPPPRCHPGTRLAIVERTLRFFADRESNKRLLWLVGAAGVGKSAIMQSLAESSSTPDFTLGASIFFSVNGRDNGSKSILTLAYQLAVKSEPYRDFIQDELAKDPTILDKALAPQFNKFVIEPFVSRGISSGRHNRFLILIDGLDECNTQDTQCTILDLISSFCIEHPAAPLVWVIASRPEPHITRFLSQPNITPSYTTEQVEVDDDQSLEDVERYLRSALEKIRTKYPALDHFPYWPAEHDFLKLATAAGGLFAFGQTVVDYIDDPSYANPASQLEEVLEVIDEIQSQNSGEGKRHPMADLDVLYSRIISKIPHSTLNDTKRLLLYMLSSRLLLGKEFDFNFCCDWLHIPATAAYGAVHHLHSVLDIPSAPDALFKALKFRHKSFRDYLADFERSGMFPNLEDETRKLHIQCATRVLNGVSKARENCLDRLGGILLSWPSPSIQCRVHKENQYYSALKFVTRDLTDRRQRYGSCGLHALRLIDIQFGRHIGFIGNDFSELAYAIFGKYLHPELEKLNAFQEMSIGMLKMDKVPSWMAVIATCSSQHQLKHLAPTPQKCSASNHHQLSKITGDSDSRNQWTRKYFPGKRCDCAAGAMQRFWDRKSDSPGDVVTTFTDVTGNYGWVHHTFPDSEDPSTTWEYIVPYQFKPTVERF